MSARENILNKIRKAQTPNANAAEVIAQHLAHHPRGPRPNLPDDLVAHFKTRALKLSSDVLETDDRKNVPELLANYLREKSLPLSGVCWTELADLPWLAAGLEIPARPATNDDAVGITSAFCAIAETGTLMMLGSANTPATTSLLPETHVAIVDPKRIVATMEDAWELMRKEVGQPPRAVNFISGPSRTADIEQTVTLGAHGPYRVLLIIAPQT
jgi:L-lactate utilization protein LutC